MQISLSFAQDSRLPEIHRRLVAAWPVERRAQADPLTQLVYLVLADETERVLALAAFERLQLRYRRWADLRDAAPEMILPVLRGVTDAPQKALTLPRLLQTIEDRHGLLELDFLAGWSVQSARHWLAALPGVTEIMAAAVLNFSSLRKTVVSVDDTIARPLRRLGLANPGAPISALERQLMERLPSNWDAKEAAELYHGLRKLARSVCERGKPACHQCPLKDLCPSAARTAAKVIAFPKKASKSTGEDNTGQADAAGKAGE